MTDIICHGVPSPEVFQSHLAFLESHSGDQVIRYEHRPKTLGWGHVERIVWKGGQVEQGTRLSDTWRRLFYDNRMLRPSCYRCPYASSQRIGDLTIADYWGIEKTSVSAMRDDLGVSLVLANNNRGLKVLDGIDVETVPSRLKDALPKNPMLEHPSVYQGNRCEPWDLLEAYGYAGMVRKMRYYASPIRVVGRKCKKLVKRILRR